MASIFGNFNSGAVDTANLLIAGTTINSAAFNTLPTVAAPDTLWLTLDPTGIAGNPEIVQVTTHTAAATSCTIVRAQQGTTARQHNIGALWAHAGTKSDFDELAFRKLTTTGDTLYASAANTTSRLAIGGTGGILSVAAGIPSWVAIGATGTQLTVVGGVPTWRADTTNTVAAAKGDLLAGTAASTIAALTVGTNDTRLVADSTQTTGLRWAPDTEYKIVAAKGDLVAGTANDTVAVLTVGANDRRLVADSTQTTGLRYAPDTELKLIDAKGDIVSGSADNTLVRNPVGADALVLSADTASGGGVKWAGAVTAYSPAITWINQTLTVGSCGYVQVGKALHVSGTFTVTANATNGVLTIPYPAGFTLSIAGLAWVTVSANATVFALSLGATSAISGQNLGANLTTYYFSFTALVV